MDEAIIVEENALARSEMKYVNICINKPSYGPDKEVSWHGREQGDYKSWFTRGYFKEA